MSDEQKKPPVDNLAKELKASLAQRRPKTWKPVLALIVVFSLILAGLSYWLYPRPRTPPFLILALDGVFTPDETPVARGQLVAPDPEAPAPRLSRHAIVFGDQPEPARSDDKGQAVIDWPLGDATVAAFSVQFTDREQRQSSAKEYGRLFVWPKNAKVLVVEADETLIAEELDDAAVMALSKVAEDGWHIAYLAPASGNGHEFRKARGWFENKVKLPKGPILGRQVFPSEETVESARRELLQSIQAKFKGPIVAIVKSVEAASTCKELGVRALRIGDPATPSWADVALK